MQVQNIQTVFQSLKLAQTTSLLLLCLQALVHFISGSAENHVNAALGEISRVVMLFHRLDRWSTCKQKLR